MAFSIDAAGSHAQEGSRSASPMSSRPDLTAAPSSRGRDTLVLAHFQECFPPSTDAPVHEYTIQDADDYTIREWAFKIDETKLQTIQNITNPFLKDHIERCGVFIFAEDLGREDLHTIYRVSIGIGDMSDRFHIGCISTSQENAKAELIDWVCSTDTDAKRACEIMIENEAILFSEPRKGRN